ncbi:hypothetical protein [Candidatus Aalborgicola defluviihabitans]|uniref:hypothetical protein n=1 Tax=Candidatus Aalborgicola defluviihabitans TaxID=3386187 RepID=UPI001D7D9CB3|nr:hypothetical protein [Burkholderiales bacterium]
MTDVYDDDALKQVHPALTFLKVVDKRSGYRTAKPAGSTYFGEGSTLHGVLQLSTTK